MYIALHLKSSVDILGVDDYGIYNVVGGVVAMLSFLNSAMVQASQRYISFAQGVGSLERQKVVFSTSMLTHFTIALIILIVMGTIGLWYVNNKVVLPPERLFAANIIFLFSTLTFISRVLVVPFNASVIAYENMSVYATISIVDYVLQLIFVVLLKFIDADKLITYGGLMLLVSISNFFAYYIYCKRNYIECKFKLVTDFSLFKEMLSFASWAFLGGFGYVARSQGVNLIINLFCGPAINAARAVAYQVQAAIQTFVSSFQQALNPQITKRYAADRVDSMMMLVKMGSKYSFLALLVCCLPFFVRAKYVLQLWLGQVPEFAAEFLILALCMSLITSFGGALNTAMQATGNIKLFQIVVSIIMCLDIPAAYWLLNIGIEPYLVTSVSIVTSFLCLVAKLLLLRRLVRYNVRDFAYNCILRCFLIAGLVFPGYYYISNELPETFISFILLCLISVMSCGILIVAFGLERWERNYLKSYIINILKK